MKTKGQIDAIVDNFLCEHRDALIQMYGTLSGNIGLSEIKEQGKTAAEAVLSEKAISVIGSVQRLAKAALKVRRVKA